MQLFFKDLFIHFRERARVRESTWAGEGVEGEDPQVACLLSPEPDAGLDPTPGEIVMWAGTESRALTRLSHPGTSSVHIFNPLIWMLPYGWGETSLAF